MTNDRKGHVPSDTEIADEARRLRDRAADTAAGIARDQKDAGAERVEHVADALRGSAEHLEPTEQQLAELVGGAAGQLEGFAKTLREKDFSELLGEVESFGRRQPAVFMGAAVALGFGLARVAKAGTTPPRSAGAHTSADHASAGHASAGHTSAGHTSAGMHSPDYGGSAGQAGRTPDPRPAFNPATAPGQRDESGLAMSPTSQPQDPHLHRGT